MGGKHISAVHARHTVRQRPAASDLGGGAAHEAQPGRQLPQLVVAAAAVGENFDAVKAHGNVGTVGEGTGGGGSQQQLRRRGVEMAAAEGGADLLGVHSSSQISGPKLVSWASSTPSPKGTLRWPVTLRRRAGR